MAASTRAAHHARSMLAGLPWWRMRTRIGEVGSHSPMATKRRSASKITARSPGSPSWLTDRIAVSYTHGWPPRTWRMASGVTRTATRRSDGDGSWSAGVVTDDLPVIEHERAVELDVREQRAIVGHEQHGAAERA